MGFSLKKIFGELGKKEYTFQNGSKTAKVRTNNMLIASSYSIEFNDSAGGGSSSGYTFRLFGNVTADGVNEAKKLCDIKL
jgi:hypothetical protein